MRSLLPKLLSSKNGKTATPAAVPSSSPYVADEQSFDPGFDLLLVFDGNDWRRLRGLVVGDRFRVRDSDHFYLLADLRRVEDRVFFLAVDNPSVLRDWDSFSGSVRSVVFGALFEPGGDVAGLFRNAIYGALIVAVLVLVFQINSMSGRFADIGGQLAQIQAQLAAPVEIRVGQ